MQSSAGARGAKSGAGPAQHNRRRGPQVELTGGPTPRPRGLRRRTPLERGLGFLRRHGLLLAAIGFCVAHLGGAFLPEHRTRAMVVGALLGMTVLGTAAWRLRRAWRGERIAPRLEFAWGLLLIAFVFALIQLSGDRQSVLFPLSYLLAIHFAVSPLPRWLAAVLVASTVGQNVLRYAFAEALAEEWYSLLVQSVFTLLFAAVFHLLLGGRMWASRVAEREAVARRLEEAEREARALRLLVLDRSRDPSELFDEESRAQRLMLGSLVELEKAVGSLIEGAHLALDGHAVALYALSSDEATLTLRDGRCGAGLLAQGPLPAGNGIFGTVLRHAHPVRQTGKIPGVNWYQRSVSIRSVLAVPVIERAVDGTGYVRGVLVADRLEPDPYGDRELKLLEEIAAQISRAAEAERLVSELHRAKEGRDRLHRAAEELNKAMLVDEVAAAAVRLSQELASGVEFAALTRADEMEGVFTHVVCAAEGQRASEVHGLIFDDNEGLVSQVVRLGAPLPARAPGPLERVRLFDVKMGGFASLRAWPLEAGGKVIGTLVLGSGTRGLFEGEARLRLEGFATLVAGALSRARAHEEVAKLATTDGLTGLANRRSLDVFAARAFREAARYARPLSVVAVDVDFFKKVNDTHGHAAGDDVIRGVAAILRAEVRGADLAARAGGEEFVLVLPHTPIEGARELAERIRARIEAASFPIPDGSLQVTASLGVAGFPVHAEELAAVLARADEALYAAKEGGRNRVVVAPLPGHELGAA